jgi:hypothetical protein
VNFRKYLNDSESTDVKKTLEKLPTKHRKLVAPFKIQFQGGNTLKGDKGHVGCVDEKKMTITVASPWNFPREFTFIHEIAHLVWREFMTPKLREEWARLLKKKPPEVKDTDEEIFAHVYSNHFVSNKVPKHTDPSWDNFIKKLCQ